MNLDEQQAREIVLGLPCQAMDFEGKRRHEAIIDRCHSMESFFIFAGNQKSIRRKRRKKRYEEWDAKGGFNMQISTGKHRVISNALTDMSMASDMGVELDFQMRDENKKEVRALLHWSLRVTGV